MKAYSVLMVDDEEEVYEVIMKKMSWEEMGFHICGFARNGQEAFEMAEELQPDVLMTDIQMPYMDGLTLSRKLRELYPGMKIIIFSGFDKFEYAKEAIKIEAEEYILKPIDSGELRRIFDRIKKNLDEEREAKRDIELLKKHYQESLPVLQDSFFTTLIEGRVPVNLIGKYLSDYQINWNADYYIASVMHISTTDMKLDMDPILLTLSVKQLAGEVLGGKWNAKLFSYLGNIVMLAQLTSYDQVSDFTDEMNRFCNLTLRICNAHVTAGIGYVCDRLEGLAASYEGAKNAVSYRVMYGNTRAINIAEIDPQEDASVNGKLEDVMAGTYKTIRMGTAEALDSHVIEVAEYLLGTGVSIHKYRMMAMELVVDLYRFGTGSHIEMEQHFGESQNMYDELIHVENPQELRSWLKNVFSTMQNLLNRERRNSTELIVTRATDHVKKCYRDPELNVDTICKLLGISTSYFSTIFKRETGKTFINYLTDYRMDRAEELLFTTDDKTYLIAEAVGYLDPNYFSYVFKKRYGKSPSKFRAEGKTARP